MYKQIILISLTTFIFNPLAGQKVDLQKEGQTDQETKNKTKQNSNLNQCFNSYARVMMTNHLLLFSYIFNVKPFEIFWFELNGRCSRIVNISFGNFSKSKNCFFMIPVIFGQLSRFLLLSESTLPSKTEEYFKWNLVMNAMWTFSYVIRRFHTKFLQFRKHFRIKILF